MGRLSRLTSIAFLTAACVFDGHPDLREDYWEHDLEFLPLRTACRAHGIELHATVWDDPSLDPDAFEAIVIGTTWDYPERPEAFLATLERLAARVPLFNPLPVVTWNLRKTYLKDLAAKGAPVVRTLWCERADTATIAAAFDELESDEIIVKPEVGASAWRQARVRRGMALPPASALPPGRTMIQPFLPAVISEGELSFIFFGSVFSHCARKMPSVGDYRVQSMYGGRECVHEPSVRELDLAKSVIAAVGETLLYARVDMLRDPSGGLVLLELELIEPYFYPEQGVGMGDAFAAALQRLLG
ncbi:MAG: hypothetical protein QGG14_10975 [Planctomycetota bacterium]|nr:hypothetical protein [Planctomycetota bacterium]